jgi:hypothetical protein
LTTDTEATEVDTEELLPELWVERSTRLIYECKFFDGFILVRPATPAIYLAIRKVSDKQFMEEFDEFCGDREAAREFIRNAPPEFIVN